MTDDFVPGAYWTPENARLAVARMSERVAAPDMQAFMREIATGAADGASPAALAASLASTEPARGRSDAAISADACAYRRGRASDIPDFVRLIVAGELPPLFVDDFVEGFVAVEHEGEVIGCGGLEVYEQSGVIRSVVVNERGRGQHIGERIADLLMAEARAAGLTDVYLFTMHAHNFWLRLGFIDLPLDRWNMAPRASWQYQFIDQYPEAAGDVFPMWRRTAPQESA
jgi:N-acetylglutamate synthase-like GNAT family acetyltransferase